MEEYLEEGVSSGWRVKLYELETTGNWIDLGVGYVVVQIVTELGGPALCIVSEQEKDKYILVSKIQSEDLYEKQGETIILWKEYSQTLNIDYALSFQEALGCQDIWKTIIDVQGEYLQQREYGNVPSFGRTYRTNSIPANSVSLSSNGHSTHHDTVDSDTPDESLSDGRSGDHLGSVGPSVYRILPNNFDAPTFLLQVKHKLDGLHPSQRDYVFAQLLDEEGEYLRQLFRLFVRLESELSLNKVVTEPSETSSVALKDLRLLADILRQIVLLNDPTLIEYLLSDDVFQCVAGVFEYDRTLREQGQYRHFLFKQARLVEVIPLQNDVRSTAKFLFRLRYLKDVMLHPAMDEPGVTAVTSMIVFTSCEICVKLLEDETFCASLLDKIAPVSSSSSRSDAAVHTVTADSSDHCSSLAPTHDTNDTTQHSTVSNKEEDETVAGIGSPTDIDGFILSDRSNNNDNNTEKDNSNPFDGEQRYSAGEVKRVFHAISLLQEAFHLCTFLSLERRQELFSSFMQRHSVAFVAAMKRFFVSHLFCTSRSPGTQIETHHEMRATQQLTEVLMLLGTTDSQLLRRLLLSTSALCHFNNGKSINNNSSKSKTGASCVSENSKQTENATERDAHPPHPSSSVDNDSVVCSENRDGVVSRDTHELLENDSDDALLKAASGFSLLWLLVDLVVNGRDEVAIEQTCDTLRLCLDFDRENLLASLAQHGVPARTLSGRSGHTPLSSLTSSSNNSSMKGARDERDLFLQVFYDRYMVYLLAPFAETHPATQAVPETYYRSVVTHCCPQIKNVSRPGQSVGAVRVSRRCVLDLLCLCVSQHSYRTKYFLLRGNFLSKIVSKSLGVAQHATHSATRDTAQCVPDRHLQLQVLRLLRHVLRLKDEFYLRHMARTELVSQVVRAFQIRNEHRRDTLLTASLAELLLYVAQESLVTVLVPLWQQHGETLLRDTLQGEGATPALQELYDTLRRAVSDCVAGDREHTHSLSSSGSREDNFNFKSNLQVQSFTNNFNNNHDLLVLPVRARKENLRLREMSDEEEYFFSDDDREGDLYINNQHFNSDNNEEFLDENSYHIRSSHGSGNKYGENDREEDSVSGMKRSVEDLYSDDETNEKSDAANGDSSSVSQTVSLDTGCVAGDKKVKLPRPSSPPHYSHVPPLSSHSLSHHLLHPVGSTHSPNNQQIKNNINTTGSEDAEDALQWLRHTYATSPPQDDEEENFVAKLAKRKQQTCDNATSDTNGRDKGQSNSSNNCSSLCREDNEDNDKSSSNNSSSVKLTFSLKRPSVGHHSKVQ